MRAAAAKAAQGKGAAKVVPFAGNIPELADLPELQRLRVMIHHRLRQCVTRGISWKAVALRANVHHSTVARAAYHVNTRTTTGTIFRLAPVLGIELNATYKENW